MFVSSVPPAYQETISEYASALLADQLGEHMALEVIITLPSHEKLMLEIYNREVDLFVVDNNYQNILLDPYGLTPLDEFEQQITASVNKTDYVRTDEETGTDHLYAIPLTSESQFVQELGLAFEQELLVGVVSTSPHQQLAKQLIKDWL